MSCYCANHRKGVPWLSCHSDLWFHTQELGIPFFHSLAFPHPWLWNHWNLWVSPMQRYKIYFSIYIPVSTGSNSTRICYITGSFFPLMLHIDTKSEQQVAFHPNLTTQFKFSISLEQVTNMYSSIFLQWVWGNMIKDFKLFFRIMWCGWLRQWHE